MAFLGVNFILQKLCQCKKNDNYKVWLVTGSFRNSCDVYHKGFIALSTFILSGHYILMSYVLRPLSRLGFGIKVTLLWSEHPNPVWDFCSVKQSSCKHPSARWFQDHNFWAITSQADEFIHEQVADFFSKCNFEELDDLSEFSRTFSLIPRYCHGIQICEAQKRRQNKKANPTQHYLFCKHFISKED